MLKLNIIPQSLKNEIRLRAIYLEIKNLLFLLVFFILFYCIILVFAEIILQIYFIKTVEDTTLITKNTENLGKDARDINKQMQAATKIQNDSTDWTNLFVYLTKNSPYGIRFTRITVNKQTATLSLTGNADTRENLIKLKDFYENSEFFTKINFPIKNILEKNNINFELSATIKSYEF